MRLPNLPPDGIRTALLLAAATAFALGVLLLTHRMTEAPIAAARAALRQQQLSDVLPSLSPPLTTASMTRHGRRQWQRVVDAKGRAAWIVETYTQEGYNGRIELMLGLLPGAELDGVRVLAHTETPGLGDGIEPHRSDWIEQFSGLSVDTPPASQWSAGRPDSAFDALTGATITSMAVVREVAATLASSRTVEGVNSP